MMMSIRMSSMIFVINGILSLRMFNRPFVISP